MSNDPDKFWDWLVRQVREPPLTPERAQAELDAVDDRPIQGPPEEIGTGLYRMADGEEVGGDPDPQQF